MNAWHIVTTNTQIKSRSFPGAFTGRAFSFKRALNDQLHIWLIFWSWICDVNVHRTLASSSSVLLVLVSAWWSLSWKSLGVRIAGANRRRKKKPLMAKYFTSYETQTVSKTTPPSSSSSLSSGPHLILRFWKLFLHTFMELFEDDSHHRRTLGDRADDGLHDAAQIRLQEPHAALPDLSLRRRTFKRDTPAERARQYNFTSKIIII